MRTNASADDPGSRLARRLEQLRYDPDNLSLLTDAVEAALNAGALDQAGVLVDRSAALGPLSPWLLNATGLIALGQGRFEAAAAVFSMLRSAHPGDLAIAFNLATARAKLRDFDGALALLDDQVVERAPAAALKIVVLHHLGLLDDALALGRRLGESLAGDASFMGALAVVALDAGQPALARDYALQGGDDPDALASLGMLSLEAGQRTEAEALFDRAVRIAPASARALLGKGLALLMDGAIDKAVLSIDQAAELFDVHIGSWLAAGWAHLIAGDRGAGRARFERALALDPRFAEAQGALAVLHILEGRIDEGRRQAEIAARLDRKCLSAALAQVLILRSEGKVDTAERVRALAMGRPLDASGRTLAQAILALGVGAATAKRS